MEENVPQNKRKCPAIGWSKKFGIAAFFFFLIKGLMWLIVPALIGYFGYSSIH